MNFEKHIFFRILLSIALGVVAVSLFVLNRDTIQQPSPHTKEDFSAILAKIDRDVDTVLVQFKIERNWITKRQVRAPNSSDIRTERRVTIPRTLPTVQMNVALSTMARHYNGRAVATENLKENSVTIHIELEKRIVQTIILIMKPDLKRAEHKNRQKKV